MASPYTRAQPSNASSARRSFASWRRPPKPAKLPTAVKPQPQASAYSTSAGSAAVLRAAGNTQAPHRSGSSLPVQLGPSVLPIIPSCLQTPVKAGDASQTRADPSWRPPHGMWSAQQGTASAQHAQQGTASAQHAQQDLMSTQEWQGQTLLAMKQQGSSQEESHSASASPAASLHTVKRRQPNALQCIQTWLDANPEGHWHPTGDQQGRPSQKPLPGSTHPPLGPASVKRTAAEIQEQQNAPAPLAAPSAKQGTPTVTNNAGTATAVSCDEAPVSTPSKQSEAAFLGPQTPEPRTPAQRVLTFSPMSVTQPGACIEAAMEGTKQCSQTIWVACNS